MNPRLKEDYRVVRAFLPHYDDQHLAAFLDHLRAGKFAYNSCCCFIGAATADHALIGKADYVSEIGLEPHYRKAKDRLSGAWEAERAVWMWGDGHDVSAVAADALRTRRLTAIVKAEIRRRMRVSEQEKLDWDARIESAPERPSGTIDVTLEYAGRGTPIPSERK
jgi:hypothetical protein